MTKLTSHYFGTESLGNIMDIPCAVCQLNTSNPVVSVIVGAILVGSIFSTLYSDLGMSHSAYAASPTPIYQIASGLVYSDSLQTGDTHYWSFNGSAEAMGAPHSYSENSSGLTLGVFPLAANRWAGYFGISPLTPARLFHTTITLGPAHPNAGLVDTALYVQQQMEKDPRIDAMGCGADIYPNFVHWTVSLQAGNKDNETVPQTIYTDNNATQPNTRQCTLVTDGNSTLTAYIDGQNVFHSNKMNLNMPEPFQSYLEIQTNSVTPSTGSNFTGSFSDYYETSSDMVTVLNITQGSIVKVMDATSGKILASSVADASNKTQLNVGMYHMPIDATIKVFDNTGTSLLASASATNMYGGDVYNVGSATVHQPTIHIGSRDIAINKAFSGAFVNVSSSSGDLVAYTPFSFIAKPYQPYIVSTAEDDVHKFVRWENGVFTPTRVLRPTTVDQQLVASFSSAEVPPPPSSLTSSTQYTTNVTNPTISGNGIPGFSVQLYDKGSATGSPSIVQSNATWQITVPPRADATHIFTATETNLTATQNATSLASGSIRMTVDTVPPTITASGYYTPFDNVSLSGTSSDSVVGIKSIDVQIDNAGQYLPASQPVIGDWSNWNFESKQLMPGNHTITARATNLAGGQAFTSVVVNIPQADPSITVTSADTLGVGITGMWTVLSQNGATVQTGFTPLNVKTVPGQTYSVTVGDYGNNYFDHWHNVNTGQDIGTRTITLESLENPVQLTAIYRHTASPLGSGISVNGVDLNGVAVNGMYTSLTDTNASTFQTGFTTVIYNTIAGDTYIVSASDYGTNYFDHWHNAATGQDTFTRNLSVVATSNVTQLTATYRHTAAGSGSSIVVSGSDLNGTTVNGMYTTLMDTNNNTTQTGFTTVAYPTTSGDAYVVTASDYGTNYFDHWHNAATGTDTYTRSLSLVASSTSIQLTVVFRQTAAGAGSNIVVSGANLNGTAVNGMYTTLTDNSTSTTQTGFTTFSFGTIAGHTYIVTAANYGTNYFDHWHNVDTGIDSVTRSLVINATSGTIQLTAVYRNTP